MDCFHNPYTLTLKVVRPGFEPRQTEPKTVVLPLYYRTNNSKVIAIVMMSFTFDDANIRTILISANKNELKSVLGLIFKEIIFVCS